MMLPLQQLPTQAAATRKTKRSARKYGLVSRHAERNIMGMDTGDLQPIAQIGKGTRELLIHPHNCPILANYQFRLAGISLATNEFRFVNLPTTNTQVLVCFRGKGRVLVENRWEECKPGFAYLTPRGKNAGYVASEFWEIGWVTYEAHAAIHLDDVRLLEVDPLPMEHILYGLHREVTTTQDAALMDHWGELLRTHSARMIEGDRPSRLWRLWQKVQEDLAYQWTLPHLANLAGVSSEYLRRMCLQETGVTPMRYVNRMRMQQSISLLSKGYKVEATCYEVGYKNAFAFSTAFKKFTGHSPSYFRSK